MRLEISTSLKDVTYLLAPQKLVGLIFALGIEVRTLGWLILSKKLS
jgi:hypothetical protein